MSWAGIYYAELRIDPRMHVGGVLLMQTPPFYDDGAIRTLATQVSSSGGSIAAGIREVVYRALR
ncbi:MAG TPA: hypothetical protein VG994_20470 [Steroidobacteraceae bacterium]|nr:hypothetical protein [Steroidobacteraceae bacterium]